MKILIIGANSAIARATALIYAGQGSELFLVGRNEEKLAELATELESRGAARVGSKVLDVTLQHNHRDAIAAGRHFLNELDIALICHGSLPQQEHCESDFELAQQEINVNGLSVISLLTELAAAFKSQGQGCIAVITSVAGDRGRRSNYIYGAAKSLVSTYLQGLRGRLHPHGVHVIDIRPGLVASPMTAHLKKGMLFSSPERVARSIVRGIERKRHIIYAPAYWRLIMTAVKLLPEFIFKRLKF